MPETPIPCILFPDQSCLTIDFELPKPKVIDKETVASLIKDRGLTEAQAEFCAGCSRTDVEKKI